MMRQKLWFGSLLGCVLVASLAPSLLVLAEGKTLAAQNKEKVYRSLTPAQVEKLLADMSIKTSKSQDQSTPDQYYFDFERNDYKIRLSITKGRLLHLAAYFPKLSLEKINVWNIDAKFSRAVLLRIGDRDNSVVESYLDSAGGVSDNTFRQFIRRFDTEVTNFDAFQRKN